MKIVCDFGFLEGQVSVCTWLGHELLCMACGSRPAQLNISRVFHFSQNHLSLQIDHFNKEKQIIITFIILMKYFQSFTSSYYVNILSNCKWLCKYVNMEIFSKFRSDICTCSPNAIDFICDFVHVSSYVHVF